MPVDRDAWRRRVRAVVSAGLLLLGSGCALRIYCPHAEWDVYAIPVLGSVVVGALIWLWPSLLAAAWRRCAMYALFGAALGAIPSYVCYWLATSWALPHVIVFMVFSAAVGVLVAVAHPSVARAFAVSVGAYPHGGFTKSVQSGAIGGVVAAFVGLVVVCLLDLWLPLALYPHHLAVGAAIAILGLVLGIVLPHAGGGRQVDVARAVLGTAGIFVAALFIGVKWWLPEAAVRNEPIVPLMSATLTAVPVVARSALGRARLRGQPHPGQALRRPRRVAPPPDRRSHPVQGPPGPALESDWPLRTLADLADS